MVIPMVPRPSADTTRPCCPSARCCIVLITSGTNVTRTLCGTRARLPALIGVGNDGPGLGDRLDPAELGVHVTRAVGSDARGAEVCPRAVVGTGGGHGQLGGGAVDLVVPERIGTAAVEVPLDRDDRS